MDLPCGLASKYIFLILFSGKHSQEKKTWNTGQGSPAAYYQTQTRLLCVTFLEILAKASCSKACHTEGPNPFCKHVAKQSNTMEGGNEAVRYLWCYPNGFTKDILKVLVAQMQEKIKQYETGSLSPFWDFLHSILPPKCVGSLPAPLQAASAGFQPGCNALCLVYCWFHLSYIWLPSPLPSQEYRHRETSVAGFSLYPVIGCHVIRPLKTGILVKKNQKGPFSFPFSVLFHIHIQPPQILDGLPSKQYFGCILYCLTRKFIASEQRLKSVLIMKFDFTRSPT